MLTWQAEDGHGLEGTRLLLGSGGFRALGRMVRIDREARAFTASYRLVVDDAGRVERLSVTCATAQRERHLTMNRTEDGFWLLDRGSGGERGAFGGAVDIDLAYSPMFNTLPIRRLGLQREAGDHTLPMLFVSLPDLEVQAVEQRYSTVSVLDDAGSATVAFDWNDFHADLTVDAEGIVQHYPGVGTRLTPPGAAPDSGNTAAVSSSSR